MKKLIYFLLISLAVILSFVACKKDEPPLTTTLVNQFIYDGLSQYYLWSSEMKTKKPTTSDVDPFQYFDKVLSSSDRFSWLTDDVEALLADFAGTPKSFGYSIGFLQSPTSSSEYFAVMQYVFPNTPASKAGLKRLDLIGKINNQPITEDNYQTLYGNEAANFTIYKLIGGTPVQERVITITPEVINTNPVLCDSVYQISGHKIGYMFYTDFIANYNNSIYHAFEKFKNSGVTDLVLDLRYNHGGAISAATYLGSVIAPKNDVQTKAVFTTLSYNDYVNGIFDKNKWNRNENLGTFETDEKNPLEVNLNLNKVYIIATGNSYSASELVTFCLKNFMTVVHIGGNTGGKYLASWTIHPYNENYGIAIYDSTEIKSYKNNLKKWAMQPIVAKYTNKNGQDFSNPGYLIPDFSLKEGGGLLSNWKQIGDTADTFLAQAIYLIKGNSGLKTAPRKNIVSTSNQLKETKELPNKYDLKKSAVIIDHLKPTQKKILFKEKTMN